MKTLTELYKETLASDALKKEYFAAANDGKINEFLLSHGCDATESELAEFLANPEELRQGEIADDELEAVSGGTCYKEGWPVVTPMNTCDFWECEDCHVGKGNGKITMGACGICLLPAICRFCSHCDYKKLMYMCHNPKRRINAVPYEA